MLNIKYVEKAERDDGLQNWERAKLKHFDVAIYRGDTLLYTTEYTCSETYHPVMVDVVADLIDDAASYEMYPDVDEYIDAFGLNIKDRYAWVVFEEGMRAYRDFLPLLTEDEILTALNA